MNGLRKQTKIPIYKYKTGKISCAAERWIHHERAKIYPERDGGYLQNNPQNIYTYSYKNIAALKYGNESYASNQVSKRSYTDVKIINPNEKFGPLSIFRLFKNEPIDFKNQRNLICLT